MVYKNAFCVVAGVLGLYLLPRHEPSPGQRFDWLGVAILCAASLLAIDLERATGVALDACVADGLRAFLPSRAMCTDNAAMVAAAGWYRLRSDGPSPLDTGADPNLRLVSTLS